MAVNLRIPIKDDGDDVEASAVARRITTMAAPHIEAYHLRDLIDISRRDRQAIFRSTLRLGEVKNVEFIY